MKVIFKCLIIIGITLSIPKNGIASNAALGQNKM